MAGFMYTLVAMFVVRNAVASYSLSGSAEHAVSISSFTFTCTTSQAVREITWIVDRRAFPVSQASGTNCNSDGAPANYSYTCSRGTLYTLTIPSVSFSQRGSRWTCDSEFGGRESQEITLEVYVSLATTTITNRPTSVVSGVRTVLQCSTNPCYPNATIKWTKGNTEITAGITTETEFVAGRGVTTRSKLTRSYSWSDHGQQIVCTATSDGTTKSAPALPLVVWVPVASVTLLNISSQNGMTEAREGSTTLICVTSPTNPAPSVSWYKQDQQVTSGITNTPEQKPDGLTVTTSSLSLTVSRSDRGHSVYCKAWIPGQTTPVTSNTGILDVWYSPGTPSLSLVPSHPWLEHRPGSLICSLPDENRGNPAATLYWVRNNNDIQYTGHNYTFTPSKEDDGTEYKCTAGNSFTDRPGHTRPESSPVMLKVYSPYSPCQLTQESSLGDAPGIAIGVVLGLVITTVVYGVVEVLRRRGVISKQEPKVKTSMYHDVTSGSAQSENTDDAPRDGGADHAYEDLQDGGDVRQYSELDIYKNVNN